MRLSRWGRQFHTNSKARRYQDNLFTITVRQPGGGACRRASGALAPALFRFLREFQRARSKPRHLAPQPTTSRTILRTGLDGVVDSLLAAQHALERFRRALPMGAARSCLDRLSNRLTKTATEARKLS